MPSQFPALNKLASLQAYKPTNPQVCVACRADLRRDAPAQARRVGHLQRAPGAAVGGDDRLLRGPSRRGAHRSRLQCDLNPDPCIALGFRALEAHGLAAMIAYFEGLPGVAPIAPGYSAPYTLSRVYH